MAEGGLAAIRRVGAGSASESAERMAGKVRTANGGKTAKWQQHVERKEIWRETQLARRWAL